MAGGYRPEWQGLSADQLTVSSSYATVGTTSRFGAEVAANLYETLGLSAAAKRSTTTLLRDVEVVTVSDLSKLSVESGSDVLYEAVRVGSVSILTTDKYGVELSTAALEKFGGSSVSVDAGVGQKAVVTAKDIFVAFRVITLGEPVVATTRQKLQSTAAISLGNYSVSVYPGAAIVCACPLSADGKLLLGSGPTPARLAECTAQNPLSIHAENFSVGAPGSGGLNKQFAYPWGGSSIPVDTRMKSGNIEMDLLRVKAALSNEVVHDCMPYTQQAFNDEVSSVELISIKYPFSAHPNPRAPGWNERGRARTP